ncbi:hypothetical protein L211DRAFT_852317 [Terfezia boudieri ATCC MYA-4762]|uniref:Uncharacterized protein n=1 Tax=Terfezia boudieri ATCC MYA-4762 TaxID=1051890 RepID=A0A3N4LG99_9PEZI|nr:hypothetical protein L211DRAFT_852317 [Terfezia boudieri ATCC MYA-4762]
MPVLRYDQVILMDLKLILAYSLGLWRVSMSPEEQAYNPDGFRFPEPQQNQTAASISDTRQRYTFTIAENFLHPSQTESHAGTRFMICDEPASASEPRHRYTCRIRFCRISSGKYPLHRPALIVASEPIYKVFLYLGKAQSQIYLLISRDRAYGHLHMYHCAPDASMPFNASKVILTYVERCIPELVTAIPLLDMHKVTSKKTPPFRLSDAKVISLNRDIQGSLCESKMTITDLVARIVSRLGAVS